MFIQLMLMINETLMFLKLNAFFIVKFKSGIIGASIFYIIIYLTISFIVR